MAFLRWQKGGEGDVLTCTDDKVLVRSSIASAPGSRLEGTSSDGSFVRIKVSRCRKTEEGFEIEGRLLDATRELREAMARAVVSRATR